MTYKEKFIKFMSDSGVLTFGDFTLKSGRKAPYFINTGNYKTGAHLAQLGEFYADCIREHNLQPDILFGPAYKGIPLSVSAVIALHNKYNSNAGYCFDRKEAKDHGEGGMFVGQQPKAGDSLVIIEDVMTSGKALKEVLPKLQTVEGVKIEAMIITVDRMEKALDSQYSAVQQAYTDYGIKVYSIVTIKDIIKAIEDGIIQGAEHLEAMKRYLAQYGAQ
ncbi:MAG: orotate phosphoribosyltransferase [Candidatus Treponema excrementipullorum]|uniref:Orotate phosphoribosyltransferase n=1 Tax=Candidatus Treponema excrementipullorum TaxID=2838768 RepID=A0A9E2L1J4_9SPIR|nr:orotate phosphoribosyltransferase [Candidatus Treponema excrementipullorum]